MHYITYKIHIGLLLLQLSFSVYKYICTSRWMCTWMCWMICNQLTFALILTTFSQACKNIIATFEIIYVLYLNTSQKYVLYSIIEIWTYYIHHVVNVI